MNQKPVVSVSPHLRDSVTIDRIMFTVIVALLPATIAGIYFFGMYQLLVIALSILAAVATEAIIQKYSQKKVTITDGSAILTGLLLALTLPPSVPVWLPIIGAAFAIGIGKQAFGGLGHNIFNPALVGRAFLVASWPGLMTTWLKPLAIDAVTAATPLGIAKREGASVLIEQFGTKAELYHSLLIGNVGGCIGETSAIALLLGAAILVYKGYIDLRVPVSYVGTVAVLAFALGQDPIFHVLAGGLLLGAIFMATDYVTGPLTKRGKIIFGIGAGILAVVIRMYSGLPEGVSFSILLMNAFTPLIDRYVKPRRFGVKK